MEQKIILYYKMPYELLTQRNVIAFAPDTKKTPAICREVIHLINECMKKGMTYLIEVNGEQVARSTDWEQLNLKKLEPVD